MTGSTSWAVDTHTAHRYDDGSELSVCLEPGGTGPWLFGGAEGAVWVLAEKKPPGERLALRGVVSVKRIWKDPARWGGSYPTFTRPSLSTGSKMALPCGKMGVADGGFCPSLPTDWGLSPWEQEVSSRHAFGLRQL